VTLKRRTAAASVGGTRPVCLGQSLLLTLAAWPMSAAAATAAGDGAGGGCGGAAGAMVAPAGNLH
jgi:hypothetical protein